MRTLRLIPCILLVFFGRVTASEITTDVDKQALEKKSLRTYDFVVETHLGPLEFELHLSEHALSRATEIEAILQEDAPALVRYFDWRPKGVTHLHLDTEQLQANGYASAFPRNLIGLYEKPPVGEEHLIVHPLYLRGLVVHELVHILHMDQTRGILTTLRSFFGAIGKLGGVVPRWFSEGIATWAESRFTTGGRLQSPLLDYQLKRAFAKPDFCQTIDCLDDPGQWPMGSLSYWVGAKFMEQLELEREGTVACLVRYNSSRLPFFLNGAFRFCTGSRADQKFAEFRDQKLRTRVVGRDFKNLRAVVSTGEAIQFQANHVLMDDKLVQLEVQNERSYLQVYDGKTGVPRKPWFFKERIQSLQHPSPLSRETGLLIFSSINHFKNSENHWWGLDLNEMKIKPLKLKESGDYLFWIEKENYLYWIFERGSWSLKTDKENLRLRLKPTENLRQPRLINLENQLKMIFAVQFRDEQNREVSELRSFDYLKGVVEILYQSFEPFELLEAIDDLILIRQKNQLIHLAQKKLDVPQALVDNLVQLRLSNDWSHLVLKGDYRRTYLAQLPMSAQRRPQTTLPAIEAKTFAPPEAVNSYPALSHFKPHYWTLGIGGSENLTRYDVATSVNDPLSRHTLSMRGSFYQEISKSGGLIDYAYWPGSFGLGLSFDKSYFLRGTRRSADSHDSTNLTLNYRKDFWRLAWRPSLFYAMDNIDDFISTREQQQFGVTSGLFYTPLFNHSFIGSTSLQVSVFQQRTEGFENFRGERAKLSTTLRSGWTPLEFHFSGAFSKLHKRGLQSGILYGGGSEALLNLGGFHEFYGITYGDLLGNEIRTARGQMSLRLFKSYSGPGLFPVYLKTTHLLLGVDYAKSRNIFLDDRFLLADNIQSIHGGLSFKIDFAYFMPLSADFIYAQVKNPEGADQNQFLFLIRGDLSFTSLP